MLHITRSTTAILANIVAKCATNGHNNRDGASEHHCIMCCHTCCKCPGEAQYHSFVQRSELTPKLCRRHAAAAILSPGGKKDPPDRRHCYCKYDILDRCYRKYDSPATSSSLKPKTEAICTELKFARRSLRTISKAQFAVSTHGDPPKSQHI